MEKEVKEENTVAGADVVETGAGGGGGGSGPRPKRARGKNSKQGSDVVDNSRFHCNYCARDLSSTIRARCAECTDFDLCLDCFSVGATLWPHSPTHAYRLVEIVTKPIFSESWGADEEERLLEGLEMYGVDNWEDIAKIIQTRNKRETEMHFHMLYLNPKTAPIPDMSRDTLLPKDDPEWVKEETDPDPKVLKVMHLHQNEAIAGWMPKRKDFVYEWDNEAEDVVAEMEITEEDTEGERELKLRVLEIYNMKLDERQRRKEFVISRNLLDMKAQEQADKKRPREEKELRDKLKPFARFNTDAEHKALLKGILDEKAVRHEVEVYREGRMMGARSVQECGRITSGRSRARSSIIEDLSSPPSRRPRGVSNMRGVTSRPVETDVVMSTNGVQGGGQYGNLEGAELLSKSEVDLCRGLKVSFHQYMIVKDVMVRESHRNKFLRLKDAKALIKMDPSKIQRIYNYLVDCRWVSTPNTSTPNTPGSSTKSINGVVR